MNCVLLRVRGVEHRSTKAATSAECWPEIGETMSTYRAVVEMKLLCVVFAALQKIPSRTFNAGFDYWLAGNATPRYLSRYAECLRREDERISCPWSWNLAHISVLVLHRA